MSYSLGFVFMSLPFHDHTSSLNIFKLKSQISSHKTQGEDVQSKADDGTLSLETALRKKQVIGNEKGALEL